MAQGRSFFQLITDRFRKHGLYDSPDYWDMKAESYQGLARSNWPSNAYNEHVHRAQMGAIDELLGDVAGLAIADVGCGTGRSALHLARRGATVRGWDFSPKAVRAAQREAEDSKASASFEVGNVLEPFPAEEHGRYDVVLSLGCLTLACKDHHAFDEALGHLLALLKPEGRILFVEPIHRSRLLKRILPMSVEEWLERASLRSLDLVDRRPMMFVPARYLLAFRDLPRPVVAPVFAGGERVLAASPAFERLGDYKALLFRRRRLG